MTRIATLAQHNLIQSQLTQVQKRLQGYQIQLSSGQEAQRYSGIASESSRLINLESTHSRTDRYLESNNAVELRLNTMELSVAKTFDIASDLKTLLINAISSNNAEDLPLALTTQGMMNELSRILNVKLGDRHLFSGSETATAPVDLTDPDFTAPPGVYPSSADTSYYQGDSTRTATRVADDFDVTWGVTADEAGFEQLMRALHLTNTTTTSPTIDTARLQEALNVVNEAIDNIPTIRSRIGSSLRSIESANSSHNDLKIYMEETITDIKGVDIPLAVSKMTNDQTLLEASFLTVSRLSSLSLSNFLA